MKATIVELIGQEIEEPLHTLGLDLEGVELTPAGKRRVLRVAVDQDGGVTLDEVAEATRAISGVLDSTDVMGNHPYTLEVTSRGVDRPLSLERHWRRSHDRLVAVTHTDGSTTTGRVLQVSPDGAVLQVDGSPVEVGYADVARAVVQVELNRRPPAESTPTDREDS